MVLNMCYTWLPGYKLLQTFMYVLQYETKYFCVHLFTDPNG